MAHCTEHQALKNARSPRDSHTPGGHVGVTTTVRLAVRVYSPYVMLKVMVYVPATLVSREQYLRPATYVRCGGSVIQWHGKQKGEHQGRQRSNMVRASNRVGKDKASKEPCSHLPMWSTRQTQARVCHSMHGMAWRAVALDSQRRELVRQSHPHTPSRCCPGLRACLGWPPHQARSCGSWNPHTWPGDSLAG